MLGLKLETTTENVLKKRKSEIIKQFDTLIMPLIIKGAQSGYGSIYFSTFQSIPFML